MIRCFAHKREWVYTSYLSKLYCPRSIREWYFFVAFDTVSLSSCWIPALSVLKIVLLFPPNTITMNSSGTARIGATINGGTIKPSFATYIVIFVLSLPLCLNQKPLWFDVIASTDEKCTIVFGLIDFQMLHLILQHLRQLCYTEYIAYLHFKISKRLCACENYVSRISCKTSSSTLW